MRITESQLRKIVREETKRLLEMGRYGGGRHGMSYGYGSYGGDYPRGGSDEYERTDEPEIDQLFAAEYQDPYNEFMYLEGQTPEELALFLVKGMNKRNNYGYSESEMKAAARRIAAKYA